MGIAAGQIVEDADFALINRAGNAKPIGRLVASGTVALADNVQVVIPFTAEEIDTHGFHSTVTNPARVTPTIPGYYRFFGTGYISAVTTPEIFDVNLRKNGANLAPADRKGSSTTQAISLFTTALIECDGIDDFVELAIRQNSAGATTTNQSSQFSSVLEWEYVRGLA